MKDLNLMGREGYNPERSIKKSIFKGFDNPIHKGNIGK